MAGVLHESEVLPEAVFTPKAAASLSFLAVPLFSFSESSFLSALKGEAL